MDFKFRALLFSSIGHFSNDGNFLLFPVLLAYFASFPGANIAVLGSIAVITNVLSGVLSTPIGVYADRVDSDSKLMSLGIAVNAFAVPVFAFAFIYPSQLYLFAIAGSIVLGIGQSFYHPIGASIISYAYGRKKAPVMMGINGSMGSIGRSAIPALLVALMGLFGALNGLALITLYLFAAAAAIYLGLHDFRRDGSAPASIKRVRTQKKTHLKDYRKFLVALAVIVFIRSMFLSGTVTYTPTYMDLLYNSKAIMGLILTISFSTAVIGQLIFGLMTAKRGGRYTTMFTTVFAALSFALFMLSNQNAVLGLVTYSTFVFFVFSGFPILLGYIGQMVPREHSTTSNALVWGIGNTLGGAAGIGLMSMMLLYTSMGTAMWLMFLFALASVALLPLLPVQRGKPGRHITIPYLFEAVTRNVLPSRRHYPQIH